MHRKGTAYDDRTVKLKIVLFTYLLMVRHAWHILNIKKYFKIFKKKKKNEIAEPDGFLFYLTFVLLGSPTLPLK